MQITQEGILQFIRETFKDLDLQVRLSASTDTFNIGDISTLQTISLPIIDLVQTMYPEGVVYETVIRLLDHRPDVYSQYSTDNVYWTRYPSTGYGDYLHTRTVRRFDDSIKFTQQKEYINKPTSLLNKDKTLNKEVYARYSK